VRIAFICKRQYMGKDVILDRYARLYEIPYQLARLGHTVGGFCLSYHGHDEGQWTHEAGPGELTWRSSSLGRVRVPALLHYPHHLLKRLRQFAPDLLIGASDIPHVALSAWLAKRLGIPYAVDLYDNFEGFGQARIPGMVTALRRATRNAALVTTTSEPLKELVTRVYKARGEVIAMPSSVDTSVFYARDKAACRHALNLPPMARLVGTAGGLSREKGIAALYAAWEQQLSNQPDVHLVLAGPVEKSLPIPQGSRVHHLGMLPHAQIAELFCALDVGVISVLDTPFGRYCFPQKAYEMLACELPVVAADIGAVSGLLATAPACLFRPDDAIDLARCVLSQLATPMSPSLEIKDWHALIASIEPKLRAVVGHA
jgi:glycosyltransferase involved in cell wall biosynthesis